MVLLDFQEDSGRNGELVFKPVCFVQCFPFVSGAGVGRFFRLLRHLRSLGTQILQWWVFFALHMKFSESFRMTRLLTSLVCRSWSPWDLKPFSPTTSCGT